MNGTLRIAVISDVSLGYGTPQILRFTQSLVDRFGGEACIYEPDQSERPQVDLSDTIGDRSIETVRVNTSAHPYSVQGQIEYTRIVGEKLKSYDPHIAVFSTTYAIQVLDVLDSSRIATFLYCLEGMNERDSHLWPLVRKCDVVLFPERNRAQIYTDRYGGPWPTQAVEVLYNGNYPRPAVQPDQRIPRLFYGGSFHKDITNASYFLQPEMLRLPIDIYGIIDGFDDSRHVRNLLNARGGGAKYCGYLEANDSFFSCLASYAFSIITWNPDDEARYYAAPNKLFDALACGVPIVSAPHPQCVEIINKWNCGILLDDWSQSALVNGLHRACASFGSTYYSTLVRNTQIAMEKELSWEKQFAKVLPVIEEKLETKIGHIGVAAIDEG